MSDIADLTQDRAEREAPYLLAAARKPAGPVANGRCHWCDEPVGDRFCDADCRNDWDHVNG